MLTLESRLTWARGAAGGLSQAKLSELADLSSRLVGMIERGDRPNPELSTIQAIAKVLGVRVGWLASGEGPAPDPADVERAVRDAEAELATKRKAASGDAPPTVETEPKEPAA